MSPSKPALQCPHCGRRLLPMAIPDGVQWEEECHYVCFNDDCAYYRDGWEWMMEKFGATTSYRYRVVDADGRMAKPLACWSHDAHRDRIIAGDGS